MWASLGAPCSVSVSGASDNGEEGKNGARAHCYGAHEARQGIPTHKVNKGPDDAQRSSRIDGYEQSDAGAEKASDFFHQGRA